MRSIQFTVFATTLFFCLASLIVAQDSERKLKAKDVPTALTAAAAKAYPNARIVGWTRETEAGKVLYEAEMREGQTKRDVLFTPDGKIDLVEEVVSISDVPPAVQNALKMRYPKATINQAERLTADKEVQYELHVKNAPKREVVFTPDGKFVKEE
jgi:Putative beta-lactamase-inhibitor-like, PepSY-like